MKWNDLSPQAQSILEWQEHVLTGKPQRLVIERNKVFFQRCPAFKGDVNILVTDTLFNEIKHWLPNDHSINYSIEGDVLITEYKDEIKAKLN